MYSVFGAWCMAKRGTLSLVRDGMGEVGLLSSRPNQGSLVGMGMALELSVFMRSKCIFCRGSGYASPVVLAAVCMVCDGIGWTSGVYYHLDTMNPEIWMIWEHWATC
jgi:hypothetical protein